MDATVLQLRERAAALRVIAARLEATPLLSLDGAAGPDTWVCPAADEYVTHLHRYQFDVLQAADDLRWEAWQLEVRANDLEAQLLRSATEISG